MHEETIKPLATITRGKQINKLVALRKITEDFRRPSLQLYFTLENTSLILSQIREVREEKYSSSMSDKSYIS